NGVGSIPTTSSASLNFDEWCLDDLTNIWDLQIADLTDDGLPDIVLAASHDGEQLCETVFRRGLGYVENLGGRQLAAEAEWILHEPQAVSRAFKDLDSYDLDGNGQMDVSVVPDQSPHRYFFHVGVTWQQCPQFTAGGYGRFTAVQDWNGDGLGDAVGSSVGVFRLGEGQGLAGFSLVETDFSGLGSPTTGQFDLAPGHDLVGFGTGVVNLYSNLILPVGVAESGPAGGRDWELRVEPSVLVPGLDRIRLRLAPGGSVVRQPGRMTLRVLDHGGRIVWSEERDVALEGDVIEWPFGAAPRLASGVYRVVLASGAASVAGSMVILR
ncbi:MAG: VCBS repeat-containing protein, partial [Candidatus Eisenbacteria bacterium]|nr:VCBS repeat-containing protein [Candidatus Eisenbacteria bacterium]